MSDRREEHEALIEEVGLLRVRLAELERAAAAPSPTQPGEGATDLRRADEFLRLQRDLAVSLATITSVSQALRAVLNAAVRIEGIDCGGVYFVNPRTGGLDLVAYLNLSEEFIQAVRAVDATAPRTQMAMRRTPLYFRRADLHEMHPPCIKEEILALASIPVCFEGEVLAVLNLASRTCEEIPLHARDVIETIAAQIGSAVSHVRSRELLQSAHDALEVRVRERTAELQSMNDQLRREITERKRAEDIYRFVSRSSLDGFCVFDMRGMVVDANEAYCRMIGYALDELRTMHIRQIDVIDTPDEMAARMRRIVLNGSEQFESRHRRKDGTLIDVEISANYMSENGRCFVFIHDISQRKRDLEEKERLDAQLREAQKMEAVGRLAGGIAHDFNNLMATVLGLASHLRLRRKPGDREYAILGQIEEAADTAGKLAHQLLVFAKGGKIMPGVAVVGELVQQALRTMLPVVPPGITLREEVAPDAAAVECDRVRLQQAIANLCRNALQAMPNGGTLTVRAGNVDLREGLPEAHPPLPPGQYVRVCVEDTGCGIPADLQQIIFEPFFTTREDGHGMGLAATFGVMRAHGGAVSVTSEVGKGSTFCLFIPPSSRRPPGAAEPCASDPCTP